MRYRGRGVQQVYLSVRRLILRGCTEFTLRHRYPEIRELELKKLARVLLSTDSSPTLHALKDKIKKYTAGQLPHAEDLLPALYQLMETDEVSKESIPPEQPAAPPKQATCDDNWERLKDALTWSLTSGSFLDSQFYVLDSKPRAGAPTIRPVYFCSRVGGTFLPRLVKCGFLFHDCVDVIEICTRFVENPAIQ